MTETAMVLTQDEWDDVEHMVLHYVSCTDWIKRDDCGLRDDYLAVVRRRRELAQRIREANS